MSRPASLFLLPFALPLAGQLIQLLIQPPLELGPLGWGQGPVLGPTAGVQDSFPADSLPGVGASPLPTAMDLGGTQQSVRGPVGTRPCNPAHHSSEGLPPLPAHGPFTCRLPGGRRGGLHTLARLGPPHPSLHPAFASAQTPQPDRVMQFRTCDTHVHRPPSGSADTAKCTQSRIIISSQKSYLSPLTQMLGPMEALQGARLQTHARREGICPELCETLA